jgi:tryptophan synthase beta subunit
LRRAPRPIRRVRRTIRPETLIPAIDELERAYDEARADPTFVAELEEMLTNCGPPIALTEARFSEHVGAPVWPSARI